METPAFRIGLLTDSSISVARLASGVLCCELPARPSRLATPSGWRTDYTCSVFEIDGTGMTDLLAPKAAGDSA